MGTGPDRPHLSLVSHLRHDGPEALSTSRRGFCYISHRGSAGMQEAAKPRVQNAWTRGSPATEEQRKQREPVRNRGSRTTNARKTVRRGRITHAAAVNSSAYREENGTPHAGLLGPGRDVPVLQGLRLTIGIPGTGD